ncbi:MAG TPA: hypothetical protein VN673_13295 [Clostridia bacterium]|nr:hypothetical protein [Clostridia bacterium]
MWNEVEGSGKRWEVGDGMWEMGDGSVSGWRTVLKIRAEFAGAPGLIAAEVFPVGEVLGVEVAAGIAEALKDGVVGETLIEHLVDGDAVRFGQTGDFAVARPGGLVEDRAEAGPEVEECAGCHRMFDMVMLV